MEDSGWTVVVLQSSILHLQFSILTERMIV